MPPSVVRGASLACLDGAVLELTAEPVRDRDGVPYEATLALRVDGHPAGRVGERCLGTLSETLVRLAAAADPDSPSARRWADPSCRFPASTLEEGLRRYARTAGLDPDLAWRTARPVLPRDGELFALRHRDPDDPEGGAELRCWLRVEPRWVDGRWRIAQRAVLDAWTDDGRALRAVLTAPDLAELLRTVLSGAGVPTAALRPTG